MCVICQTLVKSKKVSVLCEDGCDKLLQAASGQWERCDYGNIDVFDILKHHNCAGKRGDWFKPSSKKKITDRSIAVLLLWIINVISVVCLLCFCTRLFIFASWSPAGKGLTSWLSFVMSNCDFVTFQLVSFIRCGT